MSTNTATNIVLSGDDAETVMAKRDVSRQEFRAAALAADWRPEVIDLFLRLDARVDEYVKVGRSLLRVVDWPRQMPAARRGSRQVG